MKSLLTTIALFAACAWMPAQQEAEIVFTDIPKADPGGPERTARIAGRVNASCENCSVILFSKAAKGGWFVQPRADDYPTPVIGGIWASDGVHLGLQYAAILAKPGYAAAAQTETLPSRGEKIVAVAIVHGKP